MKDIRFITFVLIIGTLVLSACSAAAATPLASPEPATEVKVDAMPVSFVGIVDSIAGDQWVISGTRVTVDTSIVRDGPFHVGDRVKVEGLVNPDGSLKLSRVEAPIGDDNSNDANINDDHGNDVNSNDDNSNSVNTNDDSVNDSNSNDDNSVNSNDDSNINDDNGNDANTNDDNGGNSNSDDNSGSGGNDNGNGGGSDDSGGGNDDNGNGG